MKVTVGTVPRRRIELGLLILAVGLTVGAHVLSSLAKTASVPANIRVFLGFIVGLLAFGHIALRRVAKHADATLFALAAVLNGIGYVMIARLRPNYADKQAMWTAVGVLAFVATLVAARNIRKLEYLRYTFLIGGIFLLLTPLIPGVGYARNGSRIWAHIGPITFQPGEIAKVVLCIFFASYLQEKRELLAIAGRKVFGITLPEAKHIGPVALAWLMSIGIMVLQKDLGSSLLFFALFVSMLWVATGRGSYVLLTAMMFLGGAAVAYNIFSHVQTRVSTWINPWPVASGKGYQIIQSVYAFGSGGITGTGLNRGVPTRIPAAHNDFILAAIGEELGLFGTSAVIIIFFLMVGSGLKIALRSDHPFEKLLAIGLTTILSVQTFIIAGGVTRLVPLTGVTLPFVSYGGSSLVVNFVVVALLLRLSHDANVRHGDPVPLTWFEKRRNKRVDRKEAQVHDDVTSLDLKATGSST
jgi:cell division protein FtsW (lipid II flippase)